MNIVNWLPWLKLTSDPNARENLNIAYQAATHSNDPSTQVGAYLKTSSNDDIIIGSNKFCENIEVTEDRLNNRDLRLWYTEHAERNTIFAAAKNGIKTDNGVLYAPWNSCNECGRAIIQAGIKRIVGHKQAFDRTPERWRDSIARAYEMFEEAGVVCEAYDGKICSNNSIAVRMNGEIWHP